jgi:hypothetical protein
MVERGGHEKILASCLMLDISTTGKQSDTNMDKLLQQRYITSPLQLPPFSLNTNPPHLQPRIHLIRHIISSIRIPRITQIKHILLKILLPNILRAFQNLHKQPPTHMPREMAMQRPRPRIILLELQHHETRLHSPSRIARILHLMDVAAQRVSCVDDAAVPVAEALGENVVVVAVQMHGVSADERVVNEVKAHVFSAGELVDVPLWLEVCAAVLGFHEDGRVIIAAVRLVVEVPDEVCAVGFELEVDALRYVG